MAKGTEFRTDFTGRSASFNKEFENQRIKADQLGRTWEQNSKKFDKVGKAGRGNAQGILEMSRAFEDAQYGMRGVLNNIPGLVMGFGGGAAAAGVISLAAVSADLAFRKFGGALKKTSTEADDMAAIMKASADSVADDLDRLGKAWDKYGEKQDAYNQLKLEELQSKGRIKEIEGAGPYEMEAQARQEAAMALRNEAEAVQRLGEQVRQLRDEEAAAISAVKAAAEAEKWARSQDNRFSSGRTEDKRLSAAQALVRAEGELASIRKRRREVDEAYEAKAYEHELNRDRERMRNAESIAKTNKALAEEKVKKQEELAKQEEKDDKAQAAEEKKAMAEVAKQMKEQEKLSRMIFAGGVADRSTGGGWSQNYNRGYMGPAGINIGSSTTRPREFRGLDRLEKLQSKSVMLNERIESHLGKVVREL